MSSGRSTMSNLTLAGLAAGVSGVLGFWFLMGQLPRKEPEPAREATEAPRTRAAEPPPDGRPRLGEVLSDARAIAREAARRNREAGAAIANARQRADPPTAAAT